MPRVRLVAGVVTVAGMLMLGLAQQAAASSANVAALQAALKSLGLYRAQIDGVKGPLTTRAVMRLQQRKRIAVDGVAGRQTRRALGRRGRPALGTRLVRSGQRGWDVAALQFLLRKRGFRTGGVDGVFGLRTARAVMRFQRSARLAVDGVAGPATISALRRRGTGRSPTPGPGGPVTFYRPVPGPMGDRFGAPRGRGKNRRRHGGIDFPAATGTLVQAAGRGRTIFAGWNTGGYGNLVVIQHRLGYTTWYGHLSRITSWVGENVVGGTRIGYVGSTGYSTGPHLHWEVRLNNVPVDPMPYLLPGTAVSATAAGAGSDCRAGAVNYRTVRIDAC
jgi:peptidoglycan hydrolase-like protein with peptidoglycan-binding domain